MQKTQIKRDDLKKYKDMQYTKNYRNVRESDIIVAPDLLPAIKLLHAIYVDNMKQVVKPTVV